MKKLPGFRSYGEYSSSNYGVNCMVFDLPNGIDFYYSYQTLVAFRTPEHGLTVCKNTYSNTTGKHLNWIDGGNKATRLDREEFEELLQKAMKLYGLSESE